LTLGRNFLGYKTNNNTTVGFDNSTNTDGLTSNLQKITLSNAIFDYIYADRNSTKDCSTLPEWDETTVLSTHFENTCEASNLEFDTHDLDLLRIKRREHGTFEWITIFEKSINSTDDYAFIAYDNLNCASKYYDYALIPVISGIEQNYIVIEQIYSEFDGIFLIGSDAMFGTMLNIEKNFERINTTSIIETLNSKCPYVSSNGISNYDTGNISALWINYTNDNFDLNNARKYRTNLMDFLNNKKPKILKTFDGKAWIVQVTDNISESQGEHWEAPTTTFSWTQIGNAESYEDLNDNGLITREE